MTAPDSRDSVDKIVADLHEAIEQNCGDNIERRAFRQLADRLQALARGPTINPAETDRKLIGAQQAGGEDAPPCPVWLAGKDVSHAWAAGWNARNPHYAALQAEVARLRESLSGSRNVLDLLRSVVSAEGVSKFTHVESRSGSLVCVQSTINAIDAALNGGQDDAT